MLLPTLDSIHFSKRQEHYFFSNFIMLLPSFAINSNKIHQILHTSLTKMAMANYISCFYTIII